MPRSSPGSENSATTPHRRLRILVADDEKMIRRAIQRLLERRGHTIDEAADAPAALARLRAERYDAVLVDARMPGNGASVLEALEKEGFRGRIVLMTGAHPDDVAPDAPDRVVRMKKPFDFAALIDLLEGRDESAT